MFRSKKVGKCVGAQRPTVTGSRLAGMLRLGGCGGRYDLPDESLRHDVLLAARCTLEHEAATVSGECGVQTSSPRPHATLCQGH